MRFSIENPGQVTGYSVTLPGDATTEAPSGTAAGNSLRI